MCIQFQWSNKETASLGHKLEQLYYPTSEVYEDNNLKNSVVSEQKEELSP